MTEPHVPKPKSTGGLIGIIPLGDVARRLRESKGLSQVAAAKLLEVTSVHLCNIEGDKARPSAELLGRYRKLWGVDLYVLAWCLSGEVERLPPGVRSAARRLTAAWRKALGDLSSGDSR